MNIQGGISRFEGPLEVRPSRKTTIFCRKLKGVAYEVSRQPAKERAKLIKIGFGRGKLLTVRKNLVVVNRIHRGGWVAVMGGFLRERGNCFK